MKLAPVILLLSISSLGAQELSQQQDLAIFLIHYSEEPPYQAIEKIDAYIRQVFQSLDLFNIIVLPERVEELESAITEDYFILVLPQLSQYELNRTDDGYWQAKIISSFSIFRDGERITQFFLECIGYDPSSEEAFRQAVDELPAQLEFKLRSIEEFYTAAVIIERFANKVVLELGSDTGVVPGDEYEVRRPSEEDWERVALVRVREVNEEFSIADIIYERIPLLPSDQIQKLPRIGVNIMPYFSGFFNLSTNTVTAFSVGVKAALARWLYDFRPVIAFDVIFPDSLLRGAQTGPALSVNIGVEYNIFLGRFSIIPQVFLGLLGQFSPGQGFSLTFLQTSFVLGLAYLLPTIHDNVELYLEGGYLIQSGLAGNIDTQGISAGFGVRIR